MATAPSVAEALGRRMRALREEAGWRQEQVAATARAVGLDWTQATVAAFEKGRRTFTIEVLLILPFVFSRVLGRLFRVADLFDETVQLTSYVRMSPELVARMLAEGASPFLLLPLDDDQLPGMAARAGSTAEAALITWRMHEEAWEDVTFQELHAAVAGALKDPGGEAERKVARRFGFRGQDVQLVPIAAHRLWGRSLTSEREDRLQRLLREGDAEGNESALRRQITQTLISEIEPLLRQAQPLHPLKEPKE